MNSVIPIKDNTLFAAFKMANIAEVEKKDWKRIQTAMYDSIPKTDYGLQCGFLVQNLVNKLNCDLPKWLKDPSNSLDSVQVAEHIYDLNQRIKPEDRRLFSDCMSKISAKFKKNLCGKNAKICKPGSSSVWKKSRFVNNNINVDRLCECNTVSEFQKKTDVLILIIVEIYKHMTKLVKDGTVSVLEKAKQLALPEAVVDDLTEILYYMNTPMPFQNIEPSGNFLEIYKEIVHRCPDAKLDSKRVNKMLNNIQIYEPDTIWDELSAHLLKLINDVAKFGELINSLIDIVLENIKNPEVRDYMLLILGFVSASIITPIQRKLKATWMRQNRPPPEPMPVFSSSSPSYYSLSSSTSTPPPPPPPSSSSSSSTPPQRQSSSSSSSSSSLSPNRNCKIPRGKQCSTNAAKARIGNYFNRAGLIAHIQQNCPGLWANVQRKIRTTTMDALCEKLSNWPAQRSQ